MPRRPIGPMVRVSLFVLALAATYLGLIATNAGQEIDAGSFGALSILNGPFGGAAGALRVAGPLALAAIALVVGLAALLQRRWRSVLQAGLVVVLSVAACEGIKAVLPRPALGSHGYVENTFPSGHMAVAFSLSLAIAIMLPRRGWSRVVSAIVVSTAAVVGGASIVSYAHRPSDVIGAELLIGVVISCVLWRRRSAVLRLRALTAIVAIVVVASAVAVLFPSIAPAPREAVEALGWLSLCIAPAWLVTLTAPDPLQQPELTAVREAGRHPG